MELQIPSIFFLFSCILFMFMLLKIRKKLRGSSNTALNLPPGPTKLPLIGNVHQLIGAPPHRSFRDLAKKYGPIMHLQLGELSNIVFSSAETAREVLKTHDILFAQRPHILSGDILLYNSTDIILAPYGDYWRQMRKISVLELLSAKRVQACRSIREEEVTKFIKKLYSRAGSVINLSKDLYALSFFITARAAFGKVRIDHDVLLPIFKDIEKVGGGFDLAELYPSIKLFRMISPTLRTVKRLHKIIDEILENIINEHKFRKVEAKEGSKDEEDDLVDVLLNVQDQENLFPLTKDNIKAVILDLFMAGTDTSSTTIEWAMSELIKNPRVMKKAQAEIREHFSTTERADEGSIHKLHYLKLVIKETLRLHPPAPLLIPRECRETCKINGYDIPVKSKVFVNAWAIGRDPNYWTEPERFYPERFFNSTIDYKGNDFEFIPFGAGRRMCPGLLFGIANVELLLAQLLYHFDWGLSGGVKPQNIDMSETFGATVKRKNDLYLVPIPYILTS